MCICMYIHIYAVIVGKQIFNKYSTQQNFLKFFSTMFNPSFLKFFYSLYFTTYLFVHT